MYRLTLCIVLCLTVCVSLKAQCISSIHTKWNDSFKEWELYCEEDESTGTIEMRYPMNEDWSQWDYRLGEESGSIQLKWKDNPEEWEIRGFNEIVLARTTWSRDLSQWRITSDDTQISFRVRYSHRSDDWIMNSPTYGTFVVQTQNMEDPRDWIIIDETTAEITFTMKMIMLFIAIHHGSPRL